MSGRRPWLYRSAPDLVDVEQMCEENRARAVAEAAARRSYGKLLAFLAARSRDLMAAEDALSDAFAAALTDWPRHAVPDNPEAWLIAVARRKLVDADRKRRSGERLAPDLILSAQELAIARERGDDIPDERLALMFACAHPAIEPSIRAPLILQTVLGFDAATIASAFLIAPATMGQRLARAKSKIKQAGVPFRIPERKELPARVAAVLDSIYAAFSEGWSDPLGSEARRRNLSEEAIWLGGLLASLLPQEPEALGLLSLMLYLDARRGARRDERGEYVPLADQDVQLWNEGLIGKAEALLFEASAMGAVGRYQLEAALQSAHLVRRKGGDADWTAIETLYDRLLAMTGSPVVAINRAIAIGQTRGPEAALAALDSVAGQAQILLYQPYWAGRAVVLAQLSRRQAAAEAYERAIGLESDPAVRRFLQRRRAELTTA